MLWCTQISVDVGAQVATLCAHLPTAYPSNAVPLVVLEGQGITPAVTDWALARLEQLFVPGEAVLFAWAEEVREFLEATLVNECKEAPAAAAAAAATGAEDVAAERDTEVRFQLKAKVKLEAILLSCIRACCMLWRPGASPWVVAWQQDLPHLEQLPLQQPAQRQTADEQSAAAAPGIVSGQPLTERKSTFQAHLAPVHSREDVAAVMTTLLQNKKVQKVLSSPARAVQ